MTFPRVHIFVDPTCPALTSGKITLWAKPATLVTMISPLNLQVAPLGASAAKAIHSWRKKDAYGMPEVQLIIEGELMSGLVLGLGPYITGVYRFKDAQSMARAEAFEQIDDLLYEFGSAVSESTETLRRVVSAIEHLDPLSSRLDVDTAEEIAAELGASDHSVLMPEIKALAESFATDYAAGNAKAA